MRIALFLSLILPLPALAADIAVPSRVEAVTVFPSGASLTRSARFSAPAGQHRLILTDMPVRDIGGLRIEAAGVTLGSVTIRDDLTPPRDPDSRAAIAAAEAEVTRAEQALEASRDAAQSIRAEAQAARARIAFLQGLSTADGLAGAGVDALRDMSRMVGEETLTAERQALAAETAARAADQATKALLEDLNRAKQALAALDVETKSRSYLAIAVDVPEATEGSLTVRYVTGAAGWRPIYDFHLERGPTPSLELGRGAYVAQWSGENWENVALELSTVRPTGKTDPGVLYPILRRIEDQDAPTTRSEKSYGAGAPDAEEGLAPTPEPVMAVADARYDGLSVTYSYGNPVSIATGADELRIALGSLSFQPEITARAVPIRDETAFLMAGFVNGADEIILPSDQSEFYLNGTFVGLRETALVAAGDRAEFSFGPIEGLRLTRRVLDRNEGDRGVINRSNQIEERVEIGLRNLTSEAWAVHLLDQVPYSNQEDLEIDWTATPAPSQKDVDGNRGILGWNLMLEPGAERTIRLDQQLKWPADKVLR
ncbi:DUF4139 domain-containing protein [Pseudooceanicola sp.]|uniref:DUF4139 domain-containing protein n=1 Tax=Pseudooceanicola sp. TaxID=1914328 RepID=UPI0026089335|nr:DUF4139 domain-containing protein [Pseudooceanicola sp.]MDF1856350.1 DUF4139 domain-containing protein [Pseudooceanicola sp.]